MFHKDCWPSTAGVQRRCKDVKLKHTWQLTVMWFIIRCLNYEPWQTCFVADYLYRPRMRQWLRLRLCSDKGHAQNYAHKRLRFSSWFALSVKFSVAIVAGLSDSRQSHTLLLFWQWAIPFDVHTPPPHPHRWTVCPGGFSIFNCPGGSVLLHYMSRG